MNIIFDLGGVTLTWNPQEYLYVNLKSKIERDIAHNKILKSSLWVEMDKGTVSHENAIDIATNNSGLPKDKVKKLLDSIHTSLNPIQKTLDIIKELKAKQNKLFVLSNMSLKAADDIEEKYHFWDLFDGIMFSSKVKMVKPDPEIFHNILKTYKLKAEETVFVDDMKENVDAAKKIGITTIQFISPEQCRKELKKLNCF